MDGSVNGCFRRGLAQLAVLTAVGLNALAPAQAQPVRVAGAASVPTALGPTAGPAWASLTPQQRTVLGPLERDWASIDAQRKAKWLEVAVRFPTMPAADQQRVQERMTEWARMTPAERGRARLSFQESKQFSPEHKQARWEAYQALPDAERKALANRLKPADERPTHLPRSPSSDGAGGAALTTASPGSAPAKQFVAAKPLASAPSTKPVSPTVVQAKPGATTTLMTTPVEPPAHHRPGQPKIAADAGQVNRSTLLPQSGPQAAASSPRLP